MKTASFFSIALHRNMSVGLRDVNPDCEAVEENLILREELLLWDLEISNGEHTYVENFTIRLFVLTTVQSKVEIVSVVRPPHDITQGNRKWRRKQDKWSFSPQGDENGW